MTVETGTEFATIWAVMDDIKALEEDISTSSLAGVGVTLDIASDFSFELVLDAAYSSLDYNVFQGCIMSFIGTFDSDITTDMKSFISRNVFTLDTIAAEESQTSIRTFFQSFFDETSSASDYTIMYDIIFDTNFVSFAFIFEILIQIESQISVDYSHVEFNQAAKDFDADWSLTEFSFELYSSTITSMNAQTEVATAISTETIWQIISPSLILDLEDENSFLYDIISDGSIDFGLDDDTIADIRTYVENIDMNVGYGKLYYFGLIESNVDSITDVTAYYTGVYNYLSSFDSALFDDSYSRGSNSVRSSLYHIDYKTVVLS